MKKVTYGVLIAMAISMVIGCSSESNKAEESANLMQEATEALTAGDTVKAAEILTKADELGDSVAAFKLGELYENGKGVKADPQKMLALYQKSVDAGYEPAYSKLAEIYFRGSYGLDVEYAKAVEIAKKGEHLNDPILQAILGWHSIDGFYGAKQDSKKAEELLSKSAEKSSLGKAMYGYYIALHNCLDKKMVDKGQALIAEAVKAGDSFGLFAQGLCYQSGLPRGSFQTAHEYYVKAGEAGCVQAWTRDGMLRQELQFKKKDGFDSYMKAATRGDGEAIAQVGIAYLYGNGTDKSADKAVEYFKKAAEKLTAWGFTGLGWCYEKGEGLPQDKAKAIEYYEKAVEYGDPVFAKQQLKALK